MRQELEAFRQLVEQAKEQKELEARLTASGDYEVSVVTPPNSDTDPDAMTLLRQIKDLKTEYATIHSHVLAKSSRSMAVFPLPRSQETTAPHPDAWLPRGWGSSIHAII